MGWWSLGAISSLAKKLWLTAAPLRLETGDWRLRSADPKEKRIDSWGVEDA